VGGLRKSGGTGRSENEILILCSSEDWDGRGSFVEDPVANGAMRLGLEKREEAKRPGNGSKAFLSPLSSSGLLGHHNIG